MQTTRNRVATYQEGDAFRLPRGSVVDQANVHGTAELLEVGPDLRLRRVNALRGHGKGVSITTVHRNPRGDPITRDDERGFPRRESDLPACEVRLAHRLQRLTHGLTTVHAVGFPPHVSHLDHDAGVRREVRLRRGVLAPAQRRVRLPRSPLAPPPVLPAVVRFEPRVRTVTARGLRPRALRLALRSGNNTSPGRRHTLTVVGPGASRRPDFHLRGQKVWEGGITAVVAGVPSCQPISSATRPPARINIDGSQWINIGGNRHSP